MHYCMSFWLVVVEGWSGRERLVHVEMSRNGLMREVNYAWRRERVPSSLIATFTFRRNGAIHGVRMLVFLPFFVFDRIATFTTIVRPHPLRMPLYMHASISCRKQ